MSSNNNYAEDTPFLFKLLRTPAFRFIVVNHNYYGFVRQLREDLQTRFPDRPIRNMDVEKHDFRAIADAYDELGSGFLLLENFEQALKDSDQAEEQQRRKGIAKGLNRTRDRLALQPTALIVFMFDSAEAPNVPRLMQRMPDMWSFRAFILDLHKQHEAPNTDLRMPDTSTRSVHISTLGGNTQEEKLQELERLNKLLLTTTDISTLKTTYKQIAQIQQDVGYYLSAVQTWQKVQDIEEDLFEKNSIYIKQGDLYETAGELIPALQSYEKALEQVEKNSYQHVRILQRIGDRHSDLGRLNAALEFFEKCSKVAQGLLDKDSNDANAKNGLAISYEKLGETHTSLGNLNKALEFFELRSELGKQLYEAYPSNVSFKNGLAISYSKIGETHTSLGNLNKALEFFEQYNELEKQLYEAYPSNVSFKNGLAIAYSKLGDTHTSLGNLNKALEFFELDTDLTKQLYEAYPSNVSFKNGLAISYSKLGETHTSLGNLNKALEFFEQYNELEKQLYEAYPSNVSFKNGLAIAYYKLGQFYKDKINDNNKAKPYYQKCAKMYEELTTAYPSYAEFKRNYGIVSRILEDL